MDLPSVVASQARVSGELILVDDFLNHRVDPTFIAAAGAQLAARFETAEPDVVLTAEASGIPIAMTTALTLGVPVIYAKKFLGVGDRYSFGREVVSPTKGVEYRVEVSRRVLTPGSRILIVDDFLSGGRTAEALGSIAEEAGGVVVGLGFVIEKTYQAGRSRLEQHGWRVESLVPIAAISGGAIHLVPAAGVSTSEGAE